jgi:hypothetical protein
MLLSARGVGAATPGAMLAFTSLDGSLQVLDVRHGLQIQISAFGAYPVWSADGWLAFMPNSGINNEIYVWNGLTTTNISRNQFSDQSPTWSSDGRLAFISNRDGNSEIYVWDGTTLVNVSQNRTNDHAPDWNTDGQLAFTSDRDGNSEIYIWDGMVLTNFSQHEAYDAAPSGALMDAWHLSLTVTVIRKSTSGMAKC